MAERIEPPYIFIQMILEKIFARMAELAAEAEADMRYLTGPAEKEYSEQKDRCLCNNMKVIRCSGSVYNVHREAEYGSARPRIHIVDLTTNTCSCQRWFQMGVPCEHAQAVFRAPGNKELLRNVFSSTNFHKHKLNSTRKDLFAKCNVLGVLPDTDSVERNKSVGNFLPLEPIIVEVGPMLSDVSTRRIASTNESSKPSNIASNKRRRRAPCSSCGKTISSTKTHYRGCSACIKYLKKHNPVEYTRRHGEDSESLLASDQNSEGEAESEDGSEGEEGEDGSEGEEGEDGSEGEEGEDGSEGEEGEGGSEGEED